MAPDTDILSFLNLFEKTARLNGIPVGMLNALIPAHLNEKARKVFRDYPSQSATIMQG